MALVAGVDSSTQSCKIVVRDAATGGLVRQARASHPDGTEVHAQLAGQQAHRRRGMRQRTHGAIGQLGRNRGGTRRTGRRCSR